MFRLLQLIKKKDPRWFQSFVKTNARNWNFKRILNLLTGLAPSKDWKYYVLRINFFFFLTIFSTVFDKKWINHSYSAYRSVAFQSCYLAVEEKKLVCSRG